MEGLLLDFLLGHPAASQHLCLQKPVSSHYCWPFFSWKYWADWDAVIISKNRKLKIPWGEGRLLPGWTGPGNLQSIFSVYLHFHTFVFSQSFGNDDSVLQICPWTLLAYGSYSEILCLCEKMGLNSSGPVGESIKPTGLFLSFNSHKVCFATFCISLWPITLSSFPFSPFLKGNVYPMLILPLYLKK